MIPFVVVEVYCFSCLGLCHARDTSKVSQKTSIAAAILAVCSRNMSILC